MMKTLAKNLAILCFSLNIIGLVAIVGYNAEVHSNPILQLGIIANAFCGVGALAAWLGDC